MEWFRDRANTVLEALTLRRVLAVPILIAVVTITIQLVPVIARGDSPVLLGTPALAWGIGAGLLLLLYFVIEYATRLRKQIRGTRVALSRLRTEGVEIRNQGIQMFATQAAFDGWKSKTSDWNNRVIKEINNINEADAEWFSVLDVVEIPRLPMNILPPAPSWMADHKTYYQQHDFRLKRLGEMVQNLWRE